MSPASSSSSTRWCPTPEQLMILKELYARGLSNPNASQIQKIAAHLSFFGSIQGKNVFYWFQNHRARDRQKLRKKLAKQLHQQHLLQQYQYHQLAFHQLSNCDSPQNLFPEGSETWTAADLSKDCSIRTYGHDSMIVRDVGPIFPHFAKRPLETLELFPLTATTAKDQETTAA